MALKSKTLPSANPTSEQPKTTQKKLVEAVVTMKDRNEKNRTLQAEEGREVLAQQTAQQAEQDKLREAMEKRMRTLIDKQMNRTIQRSLHIDAHTEQWLINVKEYKKKELGEIRPCLDDLYYEALLLFLKSKYDFLEPERKATGKE